LEASTSYIVVPVTDESVRVMTELREIELKFLVEPEEVPAILAHRPLRKAFNGGAVRLASTYYDTKASSLRKAGLTLRVRQDGDSFVQTIKSLSQAGAFDRGEWECVVAGPEPDLSAAGDTPLGKLLAKRRVRKGLAARFWTEVERNVAVLAEGESEIEAALDVGTVRAGRRSAPVCELELELKSGHPADLFRLAGRLAKTLPLTLSLATKSERGYSLAAGDGRQPVKGGVPELSGAMSAGDAFAAIARSLLHPAMANVALLLATRDAEALHQTRVSLRRLRAALWFFKAVVADDTAATVEGELRWIARLLGEARDLDVFIDGRLRTESERLAGEPGLADFVSHVHDERTRAYDRALAGAALGPLPKGDAVGFGMGGNGFLARRH
jgi:inorganic triphosphatase YgiF